MSLRISLFEALFSCLHRNEQIIRLRLVSCYYLFYTSGKIMKNFTFLRVFLSYIVYDHCVLRKYVFGRQGF